MTGSLQVPWKWDEKCREMTIFGGKSIWPTASFKLLLLGHKYCLWPDQVSATNDDEGKLYWLLIVWKWGQNCRKMTIFVGIINLLTSRMFWFAFDWSQIFSWPDLQDRVPNNDVGKPNWPSRGLYWGENCGKIMVLWGNPNFITLWPPLSFELLLVDHKIAYGLIFKLGPEGMMRRSLTGSMRPGKGVQIFILRGLY